MSRTHKDHPQRRKDARWTRFLRDDGITGYDGDLPVHTANMAREYERTAHEIREALYTHPEYA